VGQRTFFEACALEDGAVPGLATAFLEFRAGADARALRARLDALDPDVVVVFRPEVLPAGLLAGLRALVLGFLTEPLPRGPHATSRDLAGRLWELRHADPANVDRVVCFDPLVVEAAEGALPVWRSAPLPVADRLFGPPDPPRRVARPPRVLFVGRSTEHRERMLAPAKHRFDLLHVAFGVDVVRLGGLMAEHDVGVNLHTDVHPSFENRVLLHLAAGHLVLSERLEPSHGLGADVDLVEVRTPAELLDALEALEADPGRWAAVRARGRASAERVRASRVWPRLLDDLAADVAAFGGRASS
jgi:hypothetical protein